MPNKTFHYADVLSVTDGRLISPRHIDAVYDVTGFVVGDDGVDTLSLAGLHDVVKNFLVNQFPWMVDKAVEIEQAITVALDEWRTAGKPYHQRSREANLKDGESLKEYLDKHVLPLMSSEYLEVKAMEGDDAKEAFRRNAENVGKMLSGKQVIFVEPPAK